MKKWFALIVMLTLLLPASIASAAAPTDPIKVFVDGKQVKFDVDPIMSNNNTLVQYTTVFKALGMNYSWDQQEKMVTGYNDYILMHLKIGENVAYINNKQVKMDTAPTVLKGRTLVPIRFISEATGAKVVWDGKQRTINITSAPEKTELSVWLRDQQWNDSFASVMESESLELIDQDKAHIRYEAIDIAGFTAYPTYYFDGDKLFSLDYTFDVQAQSNMDYLLAIGTLYNELEAHFGEPYRDELYFYDEADYHEDVEQFADSIAAGEAELTTTWQIGYTEIELAAFSDEQGGIDLYISLFNTK